jgi:hypothetical protein
MLLPALARLGSRREDALIPGQLWPSMEVVSTEIQASLEKIVVKTIDKVREGSRKGKGGRRAPFLLFYLQLWWCLHGINILSGDSADAGGVA